MIISRVLSLWSERHVPKCKLCKKQRLLLEHSSKLFPSTVCSACWKTERNRVRWHNKRIRYRISTSKGITTKQWIRLLHEHDYGCVVCGSGGRGNLTLDHITPVSHGGKQIISNVQPLCIACHSKKDGYEKKSWYIRLWRKLKRKWRKLWRSNKVNKKSGTR